MTDVPRRNLEIKARCPNLGATRATVLGFCPGPGTVETQCDTYFHVVSGRLKLREIEGGPAVLIGYARPDETAARTSHYRLVPAPDPQALKATLSDALGVRGVVRKRREIFLWHNVRIHLDVVDGLGEFVEFEAVLAAHDNEGVAHARLDDLCARLALGPELRIALSYSDLLGL